jgi:RNA polymerase sigma-70 factor (ECF subfamily)
MAGPALEIPPIADIFAASRPAIERLIASRVNSVHVAQDLASDLFLRVAQKDFTGVSELDRRRYLFRSAINLAIDYGRSHLRRAAILRENAMHLEGSQETAEGVLLQREQFAIVSQAIDELPQKLRDILYLRAKGETYREIADRLGVTVSQIEKYVSRALMLCRQRLKDASEVQEAPIEKHPVAANG